MKKYYTLIELFVTVTIIITLLFMATIGIAIIVGGCKAYKLAEKEGGIKPAIEKVWNGE